MVSKLVFVLSVVLTRMFLVGLFVSVDLTAVNFIQASIVAFDLLFVIVVLRCLLACLAVAAVIITNAVSLSHRHQI
jgi:hypothetical protein